MRARPGRTLAALVATATLATLALVLFLSPHPALPPAGKPSMAFRRPRFPLLSRLSTCKHSRLT